MTLSELPSRKEKPDSHARQLEQRRLRRRRQAKVSSMQSEPRTKEVQEINLSEHAIQATHQRPVSLPMVTKSVVLVLADQLPHRMKASLTIKLNPSSLAHRRRSHKKQRDNACRMQGHLNTPTKASVHGQQLTTPQKATQKQKSQTSDVKSIHIDVVRECKNFSSAKHSRTSFNHGNTCQEFLGSSPVHKLPYVLLKEPKRRTSDTCPTTLFHSDADSGSQWLNVRA